MARFEERVPTVDELHAVADAVGWLDHFDWPSVGAGLERSLHGVVVTDADAVVGVGRLVGDGARYWYVQDVMVHPDAAEQGIATAVVERLLDHVRTHAPAAAVVGLFSSPEAVSVYEELGFRAATADPLGMTLDVEAGEGPVSR